VIGSTTATECGSTPVPACTACVSRRITQPSKWTASRRPRSTVTWKTSGRL
jgi:hypothetical protein